MIFLQFETARKPYHARKPHQAPDRKPHRNLDNEINAGLDEVLNGYLDQDLDTELNDLPEKDTIHGQMDRDQDQDLDSDLEPGGLYVVVQELERQLEQGQKPSRQLVQELAELLEEFLVTEPEESESSEDMWDDKSERECICQYYCERECRCGCHSKQAYGDRSEAKEHHEDPWENYSKWDLRR
ncbi:hypothetical protein GGTG_13118 [Gaeumannomyces tritici R3-111a-1]|uniref:Uncharacterized protein n=1 Tax=Gaeumannomyces tritici (strain R3-111a-1) TaxID=644352 RepID=J3PHY7_GAET3|nr:hypothetical protein GGTG_13118 [Gaeumannomyces tritici R3-111a-1]EJT69499.1 hypothetical protein GGTG_13118 [Gaeumannomyces tritici R3-111a-1]